MFGTPHMASWGLHPCPSPDLIAGALREERRGRGRRLLCVPGIGRTKAQTITSPALLMYTYIYICIYIYIHYGI